MTGIGLRRRNGLRAAAVGAVAVLGGTLFGALPASAAPSDAELLGKARSYLEAENAALLSDGPTNTSKGKVGLSPRFRPVSADRVAARVQQRSLDAIAGIAYSELSTKVSAVAPGVVTETRAVLSVEENTDYTFARRDAAPYGYTVRHELTFVAVGGDWVLDSISTDDPTGLVTPVRLTDSQMVEARRLTAEMVTVRAMRGVADGKSPTAAPSYNYQAMADWAIYYAKDHTVDYTRDTNDCTTFVSFALYHGGWTEVTGFYQNDGAWWYNCDWCTPRHSYPWGGALNWQRFAYTESHRVTALSNVWSVGLADVVQYDVKGYGGVGIPDHTMMVTAFSGSTPLLSYHTTDTRNKPLNEVLASSSAQGQAFWALRT